MAVKSIRNQYLGINGHLHSLWQGQGGWGNFHARYIVHLADALSLALEHLGYVARVEESVQIRRLDDTTLSPRADVAIYPTRLPLNFDRYSTDKQARIDRRMLATCAAAVRGDDLERGRCAVDEALVRIKALT